MNTTPAPDVIPVAGMPATRHYHNINDRENFMTAQPMVITLVSKSGKTIHLESLKNITAYTGHTPAYTVDGEKQWNHLYTAEEVRKFAYSNPIRYTVRLRDGQWIVTKRKEVLSLGFALYSAKEQVKD